MMMLFRVCLCLALVFMGTACAKRALEPAAPAPETNARAQGPKPLSPTDVHKWKIVELAELSRTLEPVWRDTVLRDRDRDAACEKALKIDEAARTLASAELPQALAQNRIDFDQRVGELRAAIIIFAAQCMDEERAPVATSFAPIPTAFDAVKQLVGVDETRQIRARLQPRSKQPLAPTASAEPIEASALRTDAP